MCIKISPVDLFHNLSFKSLQTLPLNIYLGFINQDFCINNFFFVFQPAGVRLSSLEQRGKSTDKQGTITNFFKKKEPPKQSVATNNTNSNSSTLQTDSTCGPADSPVNKLTQTGESRETRPPLIDTRIDAENTSISDNHKANVESNSSNNSNFDHEAAAVSKSENVNVPSFSAGEVLDDQPCSSTTPGLVCPICNKEQPAGDLEAFNTHVDVCLNKGAIKEILHQQGRWLVGQILQQSCPIHVLDWCEFCTPSDS